MKRLIYFIILTAVCLIPQIVMAEDLIQCTESDKRIVCNLQITEFIEQSRQLLTNGWENTLQIHISLFEADHSSPIARSRLEATQRCYLDPFESPCLILWTGATKWQRYRDEDVFLRALSHFGIQALSLGDNLPAGNYRVRVTVQIMPSASKRLQSISNWFKASSGESGNSLWSTNTLIGSVLSSHASSIEGDVLQKTIETSNFYIDVSLNDVDTEDAEEVGVDEESTQTEENVPAEESSQTEENIDNSDDSSEIGAVE